MARFFDILFSLIAMIILLPFMIPIMIGLKLTGEHYVFYLQPRVGKGGRNIQCLQVRNNALRIAPTFPEDSSRKRRIRVSCRWATFLGRLK